MRAVAAVALLAAGLVAPASVARAHDPPVCLAVRWRADVAEPGASGAPGAAEAVCLSNRGLVFLDADGAWRVACSRAFGASSAEIPDLHYAPDGRLLIATSSGLRATADDGCTWETFPEFDGVNTPALAQDPTDPNRLVLATGGRMDAPDAIYESRDGGRTWPRLAEIGAGEFYEDLLIAPSNPDRTYVAATAVDTATSTLTRFVARSDDGGQTWTRYDQELGPTETGLRALAVHPIDEDVAFFVAVASDRSQQDRVIVTRDGGATFDSVKGAARVTGASFSRDGATFWLTALSDPRDPGLWRSSDGGESFEVVAGSHYAGCAFERNDELYLGGRWSADLPFGGLAVSSDQGATFDPLMRFEKVCEPAACDPDSATATECADLWRDWQYEIHGCTGVYGGAPAPGNVGSPAARMSACACPDPPRARDAGAAPVADGGGDGGRDARDGGGGSSSGSAATGAGDGCGCSAPGGSKHASPTPLLLAALLPLLRPLIRFRRPRN